MFDTWFYLLHVVRYMSLVLVETILTVSPSLSTIVRSFGHL